MISSVSKPELTRDRLLTRFAELYGMGTGVQIFRAPGRVSNT